MFAMLLPYNPTHQVQSEEMNISARAYCSRCKNIFTAKIEYPIPSTLNYDNINDAYYNAMGISFRHDPKSILLCRSCTMNRTPSPDSSDSNFGENSCPACRLDKDKGYEYTYCPGCKCLYCDEKTALGQQVCGNHMTDQSVYPFDPYENTPTEPDTETREEEYGPTIVETQCTELIIQSTQDYDPEGTQRTQGITDPELELTQEVSDKEEYEPTILETPCPSSSGGGYSQSE